MNKELRTFKAVEIRLDTTGPAPRLIGHAAVFDQPSVDMGFIEVVKPGAFKRSLAEGADVPLLIEHFGLPLGRTSSGTLKLAEDERGLAIDTTLDPNDPDVQRLIPKLKRGDLKSMSFGFWTKTDSWRMQDGKQYRDLIDVDLLDVSIVTMPAYPQTDVALRSLDAWKRQQQDRERNEIELLKRRLELEAIA